MLNRDERDSSTAHLIGEVLADVRTLMRQEVALARAELREEIGRLLSAAALLGVGLAVLAIAGIWILIAVTRGIAVVFSWPLTIVYAGVGVALGVIGLVALGVAWRLGTNVQVLPKTRETLQEVARDTRHAAAHAHEGA